MKTFIAFLIAVAVVSSAAVTLGTQSSITISLEIKSNSANSSNLDTVVMLDLPDTLPGLAADLEHTVICVQASDSNFTIANSATALNSFMFMFGCTVDNTATTCDDLPEQGAIYNAMNGAGGSTDASGVIATGVLAAMSGGTLTTDTNTTINTITKTTAGITPTEIMANGLPNKTETEYFKCYAKMLTATGTNTGATIPTVAATYDATSYVTLTGSSSSVAAILAVAGSALASFAF